MENKKSLSLMII